PVIVSDTIIPENTPLTAVGEKEYALQPGQTTFQVPVIEMDSHGNLQDQWANYRFFDAPKRNQKSPVKVRFEVTAIKTPNVTATDVQTGKALKFEKMPYTEPEIRDIPVDSGPATAVLVVDCSGSMYGSKLDEAKRA